MKRIILMLLPGLLSCDKITTYSLWIDNQTKDTIEIVFLEGSPYLQITSDKLVFLPNTKKTFHNVESFQIKDACGYTGIKEGEVEVITSSGRKLQKKMWAVNNWQCTGNNSSGWKQTFVITENDLE